MATVTTTNTIMRIMHNVIVALTHTSAVIFANMALVQTVKAASGAVIFGVLWNPEPVVNAVFAVSDKVLNTCVGEIATNVGWWFSLFGMTAMMQFIYEKPPNTNNFGTRTVYDTNGNVRETSRGFYSDQRLGFEPE
jgi:hypothetical protein